MNENGPAIRRAVRGSVLPGGLPEVLRVSVPVAMFAAFEESARSASGTPAAVGPIQAARRSVFRAEVCRVDPGDSDRAHGFGLG